MIKRIRIKIRIRIKVKIGSTTLWTFSPPSANLWP